MSLALSALVLGLTSTLTTEKSSPPEELVLEWDAPRGCPDVGNVRSRVEHWLGERKQSRRGLEAHAVVRPLEGGGYALDITTVQGESHYSRTLEGPTCDDVTSAGALVIALAIDPYLPANEGDSSEPSVEQEVPAPRVEAPSVPVRATPTRPTPMPETAATPPLRLAAALSGVADSGALPALGYGPALSLLVNVTPFIAELGGILLLPRNGAAQDRPSKGGHFNLATGYAKACGTLVRRQLELRACGVLELGRAHAESFGADENGSANATWLAPGIALVANRRLTRAFSARLELGVLHPLQRTEFTIENVGPIHRPASFVGRVALGLEANFL